MRGKRRCTRAWLTETNLVPYLLIALAVVVAFYVYDRDQTDEARAAADSRTYLCEKVNALPDRLAKALTLTQQIQQLTGPTTTVAPTDLAPDERARLGDLRAQLSKVVQDLGQPVDCELLRAGRPPS